MDMSKKFFVGAIVALLVIVPIQRTMEKQIESERRIAELEKNNEDLLRLNNKLVEAVEGYQVEEVREEIELEDLKVQDMKRYSSEMCIGADCFDTTALIGDYNPAAVNAITYKDKSVNVIIPESKSQWIVSSNTLGDKVRQSLATGSKIKNVNEDKTVSMYEVVGVTITKDEKGEELVYGGKSAIETLSKGLDEDILFLQVEKDKLAGSYYIYSAIKIDK